MSERALFAWSGGKDSALALHELRMDRGAYEVVALLTTVTRDYDRVSMHGVRTVLLEQQAESLGIPLEKVDIAAGAPNEEYDARIRETLLPYKERGISLVVFGDLFLEDVRKYHEDNLSRIGMKALFPLWKRDTAELARRFIALGFKAVTTCIDSNVLDRRFVGRAFDRQFLSELPAAVDACGENGEFHSFVYDGPIFRERIRYRKGKVVLRDDRFYYCDLMPVPGRARGRSRGSQEA
jgi:uncharacterized protein (TIGR00290 family)